jgi:hypothetical protein
LREQLVSLILGDVEVRVLDESSPSLPFFPANLEFLSVGEDKFALCKSSFLHLLLVFPLIEGVTSAKLEFELLVLLPPIPTNERPQILAFSGGEV